MKTRSVLAVILVAVLLLGTMTFSFAEEKTQVVIWHTFTEAQETALQGFAAAFNELRDDIEVVVQSQPYKDFTDNVYIAVANGAGPDIIFNYASTAAEYVDDGLVADLGKYIYDPVLGIENFDTLLPANILAEAKGFSDGKIHYLPAVTTGPILFYNKTLYDELGLTVPATWEQLTANSKAIYEAKGLPGFGTDSLTDLMQALMMQTGNGYIDVENKLVLFDNDAAVAQLTWLANNVQAGYFVLQPTGDYFSNDFNAGQVASYLGSCAGVPYIIPDGFEYAVAPMVQDGVMNWYPSCNRGPIVFTSTEEKEKAAYEFVKFFLEPDNNAAWAIAMVAMSPYAGTQEVTAYKDFIATQPALEAVAANLSVAGSLPSVTGASTVRNALKQAAIMAGGGTDPAEAMAECVATSNDALQGK